MCILQVGNPSNQGHYDWILQGWTALSPESMLSECLKSCNVRPYWAASQKCYDALPASLCLGILLGAAWKSPALIWRALLLAAQKKYPSGTLAEQYVTPAECLTRIDRPEMQPMARWSTLIWFSIAQGALTRGSIQAGQVQVVSLDWSPQAFFVCAPIRK